jgi:putative transposase
MIFRKAGDFQAFEGILAEAIDRFNVRIAAYCIMGSRWHMVPWPESSWTSPAWSCWDQSSVCNEAKK